MGLNFGWGTSCASEKARQFSHFYLSLCGLTFVLLSLIAFSLNLNGHVFILPFKVDEKAQFDDCSEEPPTPLHLPSPRLAEFSLLFILVKGHMTEDDEYHQAF